MATKLANSATDFLPAERTLETLRDAARSCKGCEIYKNATQTVFGEGPQNASVVFVGEQPGDQEDRQGHPFVGPAGRLLEKALAEARIPREQVYVTNAVKHFKWIQRGKRRMHQKPLIRQVIACRPWLQAELEIIRPSLSCVWAQLPRNRCLAALCPSLENAASFSTLTSVPLVLSPFILPPFTGIPKEKSRKKNTAASSPR